MNLVTADYHSASELMLPERAWLETQLAAVRAFQKACKELLVEGSDYGTIPGTDKPTLLKPGAEKTIKLLGLADTYEVVGSVEDWDRGRFHYQVRCRLVSVGSGAVVAEGLGECNSMESRYRWRWVSPHVLESMGLASGGLRTRTFNDGNMQYRIENDDIYSQVNTILKIAKKRAQVDAALSVGRLSEVFTQDLEDMERPASGGNSAPARTAAPAGPRCPQHPSREPREKQYQGRTVIYCTGKTDGAWCDWQIDKPKATPPRPTPVGRDPEPIIEQGEANKQGDGVSDPKFWEYAKQINDGRHDPPAVLAALKVETLHAWHDQGFTNEDALAVLDGLKQGRDYDELIAGLLPPDDEDPESLPF